MNNNNITKFNLLINLYIRNIYIINVHHQYMLFMYNNGFKGIFNMLTGELIQISDKNNLEFLKYEFDNYKKIWIYKKNPEIDVKTYCKYFIDMYADEFLDYNK